MRAVVALVLVLCSCTRTIYEPIVSRRTVIDTVVSQLADSSMVRALFECDSAGRVLMRELEERKGLSANQQVTFADNEIVVQTRWLTRVIDRLVEVRDTVSKVEFRDVITERRYVPAIFWYFFSGALLVILWWLWRLRGKFCKFFVK